MKASLQEAYFKFYSSSLGKVEVQVDFVKNAYVLGLRVNGNFIGSTERSLSVLSPTMVKQVASEILLKYKPGRNLTLKQKLRATRI